MFYSNQEVYDALQLIHNICETTECSKCPFNSGHVCRITNDEETPSEWILNDPKQWKAF